MSQRKRKAIPTPRHRVQDGFCSCNSWIVSLLAGFLGFLKSRIPGVGNVIHGMISQSEIFRFSSWNLADLPSLADILFCSRGRGLTLF